MQDLLQKVKKLEIKIRDLVTSTLIGEYRAAFKGTGLEFDEVRSYRWGDDIRAIDWNVTAKTNEVYIKVFREERELNLNVLFDISASQHFGSRGAHKMEVGTELAAIFAFCSLHNNDKFGLTAFTDRIELCTRPGKGRKHIMLSLSRLMTAQQNAAPRTNLRQALDFVANTQKRRSILFLISDFIDQGYERSLVNLAKRHDVVLIRVFHPDEAPQEAAAFVPVMDLETGRQHWLNRAEGRALAAAFQDLDLRLRTLAKRHKFDFVSVDVTQDYMPTLEKFFHERNQIHRF